MFSPLTIIPSPFPHIFSLTLNPKQQPELSSRIKEAIESTKDWLKTGTINDEEVQTETNLESQSKEAKEYVERYSSNGNGNFSKPILQRQAADVADEPKYTAAQMDAIPF